MSHLVQLLSMHPASFKRRGFVSGIKYGYLYNHFAVTDVRGIANGDYDVMTDAEWTWLEDYIDAEILAGRITATNASNALREIGITYWNTPNTGATNEIGFNARGSGYRQDDGTFSELIIRGLFALKDVSNKLFSITRTDTSYISAVRYTYFGRSARLIRPATTAEKAAHNDGDFVEIYTGNDGKEYGTFYVGKNDAGNGYVILSSNLAETEFANGDPIPNTTDAVEWTALTTAGRCAYDNDETNVLLT